MSYLDLSLKDLHEAIINNEVTPLEVTKEALKRAHEDTNNAFELILDKQALEQVNELVNKDKNNIFYGIPIVIKDNFLTKDIETTASSNVLNGFVPKYDAEVVTRLKEAGAIIIAKTTMDELAMGGKGSTGHKGKQTNPWDKTRMIGGSSSGSAIAISKGITPFALGSDTGDSVRKPASYGGSVGFKPTWGRISRYGLLPFAPSLDHVAYFTRNVYDAAASLNLLAGYDHKDLMSSSISKEDYLAKVNEPLYGKRLVVIKEIFNSITSQKVKDLFLVNIEKFKEAGAIVSFVSIDINLLRALFPTYFVISSSETTINNPALNDVRFNKNNQGIEGFSTPIKKRFIIGSFSLDKDNRDELFIRAQKCRRLIVDTFTRILDEYDAIVLPAAPRVAPSFKERDELNHLSDEFLLADNYMAYANFGGFPSITIPLGFIDSLPIGINITSKAFSEVNLLSIASNLERIIGIKDLIVKEESSKSN